MSRCPEPALAMAYVSVVFDLPGRQIRQNFPRVSMRTLGKFTAYNTSAETYVGTLILFYQGGRVILVEEFWLFWY